jgi:hypothetical protein
LFVFIGESLKRRQQAESIGGLRQAEPMDRRREARMKENLTLKTDSAAKSWEKTRSRNTACEMELRRYANSQVQNGRDKAEIIEKLVEKGLIRTKACVLVASVISSLDRSNKAVYEKNDRQMKVTGLAVSSIGVLLGVAGFSDLIPLVPAAVTPVVLTGLVIFRWGATFLG